MHGTRTKRIVACVFIAISVASLGCSRKPSKDSNAMQACANRLRAYVIKNLDAHNLANARNMAVASCFFAREMECVAGKPPRLLPVSSEEGDRKMGLIAWSTARAHVEQMVLKPNHVIGGLTEEDYEAILRWTLSAEDMKEIQALREKHGYWPQLRATLVRREMHDDR